MAIKMETGEPMNLPVMMYGTAWKEESTRDLTLTALKSGFRAIDTANQRKHYNEAGVGEALLCWYQKHEGKREELFLQTKYTYERGQDHRLPYDPKAPFSTQVLQSFESSLNHLHTDFLDSYVLHGPYQSRSLHQVDSEVWSAMETLVDDGRVRLLGVSNISSSQLEELIAQARIQPAFVQNRCFARTGWDQEVRAICRKHGIRYQGFSLLTANGSELSRPEVQTIARKYSCTIPQLVFAMAHQSEMIPLTGTTSEKHMLEDLQSPGFRLEDQDLQFLLALGS